MANAGQEISGLKTQPTPTPEDVAYWFFRLNGCLTIQNFLVHPDQKGPARTDADLLALRFPWRREQDMRDHRLFEDRDLPSLLLVEVKSGGACKLNGPWTDPEAGNLGRILSAVGCYEQAEIEKVADALYRRGAYRGGSVDASLIAVAEYGSEELKRISPLSQQLLWDEILRFIFERFQRYRTQKANHPQWDSAGQLLYELAKDARRDVDLFKQGVRGAFFAQGGRVSSDPDGRKGGGVDPR